RRDPRAPAGNHRADPCRLVAGAGDRNSARRAGGGAAWKLVGPVGQGRLAVRRQHGRRDGVRLVRRSRALTRATVAALYGIPDDRISDFVEYDPGCAIKFTIYRIRPIG